MNTLFPALFDAHQKPLIVVLRNGLIEKANKAAREIWPFLNSDKNLFLWQLPLAPAKEQLLPLLAATPTAGDISVSGGENEHQQYLLQRLHEEEEHLLLEANHDSLRIALPASTASSVNFLNQVLNGISDQMMAVLDTQMRYITFNERYQQEYARTFAVEIAPGDHLLDTLRHLPGEQKKILPIWEEVLKGKEFSLTETFGHKSLGRSTTYRLHLFPLKDAGGQLLGVLYRVIDISHEQQTQELLKGSEDRFRMLANNALEIIVRYSPDLTILFANQAAEKDTGLMEGTAANKNIYDLPNIQEIPESYLLKIKQAFASSKETSLMSTYTLTGSPKDYFTRFIPETDATGEVVSVIAVSRNISGLQLAQQELQQARDFKFMAEVIPQLVWITEPNGDVSYFNQQWYTYTGLTKAQSLDWGWQQIIHPDDWETTRQKWQHSLATGQAYEIEYRLRKHTGDYHWFMSRAMPMTDAQGKVVKWYGFSADVHDQKLNRTQLQERAQELQVLNQMIPQLVWVTLPDGTYEYFNQRWYEYTGLSDAETSEKGWARVLHPDDYERTRDAWNYCMRTGEAYQIEYRIQRSDGVYRWFIARALPLRNTSGSIVKWFGTCTDIHDYKQQREELSQKNYELQQINAYLDQFVHTAAHDLRSPVANMQLLYDMLMREENPEKKKKLLQTFKPLLARLDGTIVGLVEIVQMQEGHNSLVVQAVDPSHVLEEIREELADKLEAAEAVLETDLALERPLYYLKPYLQSILRNLLSNAVKYRDTSRQLHISVKGCWQGKYYHLSVTDNGTGIDLQRNSKNIFRPFKRLSPQGEGLGIGLHMVKNMIQKNGGLIEVSSEPGTGTTFHLYLNPYEYQSQLI